MLSIKGQGPGLVNVLWVNLKTRKRIYKLAPRAWDVARPGPKLSSHTFGTGLFIRNSGRHELSNCCFQDTTFGDVLAAQLDDNTRHVARSVLIF